ncbi:MAG: Elongation factor Ts [Candidatus Woesebacteria bacterium GW2011_GWA1_33_30]|uniref:Elongation factor Ts n=1 Tax=Candidatus Woesebacteria bacterium GW2011_GWA2_33_28 TaxID=1618561 RepID=A0A0G0CX34_9BACT|nr:MAG: Elongation factor Ts [Candidatus Woesebacteria bacterium GW2011_GWA2_33_28]KKP48785.1 MAG: Elongation factor Ts [Candidatus Woesebacteria bacterium GW2011_GWA1_33_30]KKP50058.1 MAG: Elongation factor Ts [Microgenomates group bacterium GW2011_GWC1_33_32]KKP51829.1 MAG: Elongation factor Ts [Candidatus Woesebacteria bacterium GW2011_GWB1_33_38]KKP57829.1 MAG: Elongation factor Ts [Microgenomates group bacterium GW2011_GWD1_33_9]
MKINAELIKKLREETGAGVMRVKQVLEQTNGKKPEALEILKKEGFEKVAKRSERETKQGKIFTYAHHTGKVGVLVELFAETDFVARNELFESLGKDIALQVASMGEKDIEKQEFIKDPSKTILDLIKEVIAKTGENIKLGRVVRIELGKE